MRWLVVLWNVPELHLPRDCSLRRARRRRHPPRLPSAQLPASHHSGRRCHPRQLHAARLPPPASTPSPALLFPPPAAAWIALSPRQALSTPGATLRFGTTQCTAATRCGCHGLRRGHPAPLVHPHRLPPCRVWQTRVYMCQSRQSAGAAGRHADSPARPWHAAQLHSQGRQPRRGRGQPCWG